MSAPSREEARDYFDGWMVRLPDDLRRFTDEYLSDLRTEPYSVESLPEVEQVLIAHLGDRFCFFASMMYVGETLMRAAD